MSYYSDKAKSSNENASQNNIDPPRFGRKTFQERYDETSRMSTPEILAMIARRESGGEQCGVAYQVLADRGLK